ncbi:hypothetical protein TTHERM_00471150 (macronuclear) [Tetrahymena thermophila SB210]|uniref:Uncharacterized protein n=1 Tax=Tetrahymena thermophila (strain SB210) TaxID=312017 RepID=I7MD20_TETTS|nr:hypothetical protein TTHERM_00471150 [Tetrahymena thermophila SB210]EAR85342.1 hypothetical protein TTHERM_00471150 [Tetrahymena thermophila SB210]|eukprot:XP_001033005.1 hypothetical protein TTHERM_00471150 [Tetrahymena thermophila SB210]
MNPMGMSPQDLEKMKTIQEYSFLMNPLFQAAMQGQVSLQESEFFPILFQSSAIIEPDDRKLAVKYLSHMGRNFLFGAGLGIFLNVQVKKIKPLNIFGWNKFLRLAFRIPLFISPFFLFANNTMDKVEELQKIQRKYFIRYKRFERTGNIKYLDPDNVLLQAHKKKTDREVITLD